MEEKLDIHDTYHCFLFALRTIIRKKRWGAQANLAKCVKKTPKHCSDIMLGRNMASRKLQASIAECLEFDLDQMIDWGKIELENVPPEQRENFRLRPKAQATVELSMVNFHNFLLQELKYCLERVGRLERRMDLLEIKIGI